MNDSSPAPGSGAASMTGESAVLQARGVNPGREHDADDEEAGHQLAGITKKLVDKTHNRHFRCPGHVRNAMRVTKRPFRLAG